MNKFSVRYIAALAGVAMAGFAAHANAQGVVLADGREVRGTIVSENKHEIVMHTEYGELNFQKINLRAIIRRSAPAGRGTGTQARSATPFGGGSATAASRFGFGDGDSSVNPFGGGGQTSVNPFGFDDSGAAASDGDPFGGTASVNPFGGGSGPSPNPFGGQPSQPAQQSSGADPFGGTESASPNPFGGEAAAAPNPFGGTPAQSSNPFAIPQTRSANPFGQPASPRVASADPWGRADYQPRRAGGGAEPAAEEEVRQVALAVPRFTRLERAAPPEVRVGYDGVLYGMSEDWPVEVRLGEQQNWSSAIDDTHLRVGTQVRTNKTPVSRLLLRNKQDELRLPQESHIELREASADMEEVTVYLYSGSIWSDVSPRSNPDSFRVQTPELTAGVRGTNFRVDRATGASKVSVFSGTVHVVATRTNAFVTLQENQAAVVNADGQIMDIIAAPRTEQQVWDDWQTWAEQSVLGSGTLAAGFTPISSLTQQIAQDNSRWESDMQEYIQNMAELRYMEKLDEYARAFERLAQDTGHIPESHEGWSMLKFDSGLAGWNGPYVEGPIPPLDPFRRPLRYRKVESQTGRIFGRVYSVWRDGRDQGGEPGSDDRVSLIMYFQLPRFENDPTVNPPMP